MHSLLTTGTGDHTIILAHGAGAPMDFDFMNHIADGLAAAELRCIRFEFPYMAQRRVDGKKRGPNTAAVLLETWREVVQQVGVHPTELTIGGKSMGGRYATMIAEELGVKGVVCLGYPFHPPGKPEKLRTEHLRDLSIPTLIVQGERDPFGGKDEVGTYQLSPSIRLLWSPDGDHSLKPRKSSGHTLEENLAGAVEAVAQFVCS